LIDQVWGMRERKLCMVAQACHPIRWQITLGKKWDPISKITRAKREAGGVAQVVEHLLASVYPSSNPNTGLDPLEANCIKISGREVHAVLIDFSRWFHHSRGWRTCCFSIRDAGKKPKGLCKTSALVSPY
jgi:hypothetical protein